MHNLQLTEDQEMVVDTVRKLVADVVAPKVQELDEHRTFVREWFDGLAELGVYGLSLAEEHGGAGMGLVPYVAALEAVGEHSGSLARLWIGQMQALAALEQAGAELDEVAAGAKLAVFVGPEHGFTVSDGALTGTAELVPGAMEADVLLIAARDGEAHALVQEVHAKFDWLSSADVQILAGYVALEASGGPAVPFSHGRRDFSMEEAVEAEACGKRTRWAKRARTDFVGLDVPLLRFPCPLWGNFARRLN